MNLKVLQWLIAHRDLLTRVLEVVKGFNKSLPVLSQWEIVDKVARLILPILSKEDVRAMYATDWDEDEAVSAFALGTEYSALGLDWVFVINTLVPILRIVLAALETLSPDDE